MIFLLILLDVLINNYTSYTSFFFIIYLYNKPYKYYLITGLILDYIVFNTYFYNIIILSLMYFLNKFFQDLNKNNFYNYLFITLFNYLTYIILSNILLHNITYILLNIGLNLFINILFYGLSFRIIDTSQNNYSMIKYKT